MSAAERNSLSKMSSEDTFTSKEVAEILHLSPRTLERYRRKGTGPIYLDINHKVKIYPKNALYQWMAAKARKSTSDHGTLVSEHYELLPPVSIAPPTQNKRGRPRKVPPADQPSTQQ